MGGSIEMKFDTQASLEGPVSARHADRNPCRGYCTDLRYVYEARTRRPQRGVS
jgi:hypothetical protein